MIKKLVDKIVETNAPIVVGLDPMMKYLPKHLAEMIKNARFQFESNIVATFFF
jgi:orotidine-5'-phosphate decarboxylase